MIRNPAGLGLEHALLLRAFPGRCLHWFCLGHETSINPKCGALPQPFLRVKEEKGEVEPPD